MPRILAVIVTKYPYGIGEPFFEGELLTLSEIFDKILIIIPEAYAIDKSKQMFELPANSEVIFINNQTSFTHKLIGLSKIFTKRALGHLYKIHFRYKLSVNWAVIKTMLAYEAKDVAFRKMLLDEFEKRNLAIEEVYLYTYWLNEYTFSLVKVKLKNPSLRIFSRIHGWDLYFERHTPSYLPYRDYIIPKLDRVFPISENGKKYILNKVPKSDPEKIIVQRLGTDIGEPNTHYNTDKVVLLTISFLRPIKHMELLIEALERMSGLKIVWHHIGGGDDAYALELMNLAKDRLAAKTNLEYTFHGTMTKIQIEDFIRNNSVDLMINTSYSEGLPVSIMQAMAFSIPAIAPDIGGMSEIIENNINGFLLSSNPKPEDLKCTIEEYFKLPPSDKIRLKKIAYNTWKEKFNSTKNYYLLAKAILEV